MMNREGISAFDSVAKKMMEVHERKDRDYGHAFDKSWDKFKERGLDPMKCYAFGRLLDKWQRLENLVLGNDEPEFESIQDNMLDLASYLIMSVARMREEEIPPIIGR